MNGKKRRNHYKRSWFDYASDFVKRKAYSEARKRLGIKEFKGFTIPGYNYCGPFNPLENGPPTNSTDRACMAHDYAYSAMQESGRNPYFKFNDADEKLLEDVADNYDPGSLAAKLFFHGKKRLSDFFEPSGKRGKLDNDFKVGATKNSLFKMTDESHYKKMKLIPGLVVGREKMIVGRYLPFQKHTGTFHYQLTSNVNQRSLDVIEILTPDLIQRHMFTPRYFQEWRRNIAIGGSYGVTMTALNGINADDRAKGIFQAGATTTENFEDYYRIGSRSWDAISNGNANLVARSKYASAQHGIVHVGVTSYVKLKNNNTVPVKVIVYEGAAKMDYYRVEDSFETRFKNAAAVSYAQSQTFRDWGPHEIPLVPPSDSAPSDSDVNNPLFSLDALAKRSRFHQEYKLANKRLVCLQPGEMCSFVTHWKPAVFDLSTTSERLGEIGYLGSVLAPDLSVVGLNEDITSPLSLYHMHLKGINKFFVFQLTGETGHLALTGEQGIYASKLDIECKNKYVWSIKGALMAQVPTRAHDFSGTPDTLILDEEHMVGG